MRSLAVSDRSWVRVADAPISACPARPPCASALAAATRGRRAAPRAAADDPDRDPDPLPAPASDRQGTAPGRPGRRRPERRAGLGQAPRPGTVLLEGERDMTLAEDPAIYLA